MRTAGIKAVHIASRIAKAARKAEKEATSVNKGEVAAALAQLKKATRTAKVERAEDAKQAADIKPAETPTVTTKVAQAEAEAPGEKKRVGRPAKVEQAEAPKEKRRVGRPAKAKAAEAPKATKRPGRPAKAKPADIQRLRPGYVPHNDYPLGHILSKAIPPHGARASSGKDKFPDTLDVVSESLCDDIIKYIGPNIDKHKGCDIIDIHPGACLWSQKLHEYLKPRRHLLLEPDSRYVDPFIQPLLDQPGSTYRHSTLPGAHPKGYWQTYDRIFNDDLLPKRAPLPDDDPRLRQPNDSLLVVGNLIRRFPELRQATNPVHFPTLMLLHLAEAAQINRLYQRYGLVRTLLWVPEDIKSSILPDSILTRQGVSLNLEVAFNMVEIVGGDRSHLNRIEASKKLTHRQRQDQLDTMSARRVLARMQEKNMTMPEHRRPAMHRRALNADDQALEDYNPVRLPEGKTMEKRIKSFQTQLDQLEAYANMSLKAKNRTTPPTPRYKFTRVSEEILLERDHHRSALYIDAWGAQVALEQEYSTTKKDMAEKVRSDLESKLEATSRRVNDLFDKFVNHSNDLAMRVLVDELWAVCRKNPMMQWDQRPFEPLTVSEDEFYPRIPMQLVELTPKQETLPDDLIDANKANRLRRGLIKTLFTHPSAPLLESIDRLGHGARDLMSSEFKDPMTGGRMDPKQLLTKDVTAEQIDALAKAYIEWPFRPLGSEALEEEAGVM